MAGRPRKSTVRLPAGLLREITKIALSGVSGPGSSGRRQRIAVNMAALLHERHDELPADTILLLTQEIMGALSSRGDGDDESELGFRFDKHGALCWTPQTLAHTLGFDLKTGLRRLKSWRQRGQGPKFIKLGSTAQSSVLYPIRSTLEWIAAQSEVLN